jgi:hypothetical protein
MPVEKWKLQNNQKEIRNESAVTEMKNAFDRLISGLDRVEERICELEYRSGLTF